MQRRLMLVAIGAMALATATAASPGALAQKPGGVLRIYHRDSPASMSVYEEGTIGGVMSMMGVFQ